jgi:hypothetical protein
MGVTAQFLGRVHLGSWKTLIIKRNRIVVPVLSILVQAHTSSFHTPESLHLFTMNCSLHVPNPRVPIRTPYIIAPYVRTCGMSRVAGSGIVMSFFCKWHSPIMRGDTLVTRGLLLIACLDPKYMERIYIYICLLDLVFMVLFGTSRESF